MTVGVFASGQGWVGAGVQSIESGLHEVFTAARSRIVATIYSVTAASFDLLPQWVSNAIARGVEVVIVVNHLDDQHSAAISPLVSLARSAPGSFKLFDFSPQEGSDLHAKAVVADERLGLVGSSNFSARGLLHNYELAVMIEGDTARRIADMIVALTSFPDAHRVQ